MGFHKLHGAKVSSRNLIEAGKDGVRLNFIKEIVLPALWKRKDAIPFLKPVDPVKQKVSDNFNVIKHPMDLDTIRARLGDSFYKTSQQCLDDFRLIFSNAALCCQHSAAIHKKARSLEIAFLELLNDLPQVEREEKLKKRTVEPCCLKNAVEVCETTLSSEPGVYSKALVSPPLKRRRNEVAEPTLPDVPIGNGSLLFVPSERM